MANLFWLIVIIVICALILVAAGMLVLGTLLDHKPEERKAEDLWEDEDDSPSPTERK